jgi:hypothetical protein
MAQKPVLHPSIALGKTAESRAIPRFIPVDARKIAALVACTRKANVRAA